MKKNLGCFGSIGDEKLPRLCGDSKKHDKHI